MIGALCAAFLFPATPVAAAEDVKKTKIRVIRRNNGASTSIRNRIDDRIDQRREDRIENREDWQDHYDEDEERRERIRLQTVREGSHGKACIYGRDGKVIHQPVGVECSDTPPGPKPKLVE